MSTRDLIVEKVILLNNEGVSCLVGSQDSSKALHCFKDALTVMGNLNPSLGVSMPHFEGTANSRTTPRPTVLHSIAVPGMEDECFYIHNRVIFLHSSLFNAQSPDDAISAQACATSIIIFNLGLACQHYGTRYQDMAKLRNACELYELAATWAVGGEEIGQLKQISAALTWAALNNQGQILYRLLGEHDIAVALLSPQLGLRPEGVEFSPCQLLEQEHFDEILFNILTVTSGIATVASPAA